MPLKLMLLAPQSIAHIGGAYRYFHPIQPTQPIHPSYSSGVFLPLYMIDGKAFMNCGTAKLQVHKFTLFWKISLL